jgi:phage major head subunit gpT-like protein
MAVINTGLLTKGLRSEFFDRYEGTTTHHQDLATRIASNSDHETYKWLGTAPRMREWGTGRLAKGLRTESYSVENLKYEATIEVDRDEVSDDQTGQIRVRIGELAQRAATHKDYLIGQLLINGAAAGCNSYDGVTFFNDAHVSGASGSQDNDLTFAAAGADNQPTTEEFKGALKQSIAQMLSFKDDQGEAMPLSASGLVCVVPPTMLFTALEAVNATLINQTSNVLQGAARVVALPWLTSPTAWYLLKTDGVIRPFIFQDREPVEFGALAEDSEDGFKREKLLFGVRARYRLTYGYWQFAVRTVFN